MGQVPYENMYRSPMNNTSYVRILHASPDAPAVDVLANEKVIASNLKYKEFTEYLPVKGGEYNIRVFPAGKRTNPVIDTDINVPLNQILTVAAVGKLEDIQLLPISDPKINTNQGRAYIRFGHLSPNAPAVDIRLPGGTTLFSDVEFKEVTDYAWADPGQLTLEVYVAGTDQRVLYVPNVNLKANSVYTVYAVGLVGEEPPLQVLIPLDGSTYLNV